MQISSLHSYRAVVQYPGADGIYQFATQQIIGLKARCWEHAIFAAHAVTGGLVIDCYRQDGVRG